MCPVHHLPHRLPHRLTGYPQVQCLLNITNQMSVSIVQYIISGKDHIQVRVLVSQCLK